MVLDNVTKVTSQLTLVLVNRISCTRRCNRKACAKQHVRNGSMGDMAVTTRSRAARSIDERTLDNSPVSLRCPRGNQLVGSGDDRISMWGNAARHRTRGCHHVERGGDSATRRRECVRFCDRFGVSQVTPIHLPSLCLMRNAIGTVGRVSGVSSAPLLLLAQANP